MREFTLSVEAYEKALTLSTNQLRLLIYSGLGQLAMEQKNYPMARRYLLAAYRLARSLPDNLHKGDVFCNLGKYYKEVMKYTTASRILSQGLGYARQSDMKRTMLYILVEMADVHLFLGNFRGFDEIMSEIHTELS